MTTFFIHFEHELQHSLCIPDFDLRDFPEFSQISLNFRPLVSKVL